MHALLALDPSQTTISAVSAHLQVMLYIVALQTSLPLLTPMLQSPKPNCPAATASSARKKPANIMLTFASVLHRIEDVPSRTVLYKTM